MSYCPLRQPCKVMRIILPAISLLLLLVVSHAEAQPDTRTVASADGVIIHYDVRGAGEPALVLLPGWTNSRQIWGRHPETLSRTHRVVTIDLGGHGASGADREAWTIEAFAEDVAAVVEDLALEQIVLVGFSMGGQVALEASERLPERTIGVVMVDALRDPDATPSAQEVEQMAELIRTGWGNPQFIRGFGFTRDAPDSLIAYTLSIGPATVQEHWFEMLPASATWRTSKQGAILQRAAVPIALINATNRPTRLEAIHRYNPAITLDTLGGVGHVGMLLQRVDDFDAKLRAIVDGMMERRRRAD